MKQINIYVLLILSFGLESREYTPNLELGGRDCYEY